MKAVLMAGIGGPEVLRSSLREDLFLYVTVVLAVLWESLLCPFASPCREMICAKSLLGQGRTSVGGRKSWSL